MIKEKVTLDEAVEFFNSLLEIDKEAISKVFTSRVNCNKKMAEHITVQVFSFEDDIYYVGPLGILNGLFGIDEEGFGGIIAIIYDNGDIKEFLTRDEYEERLKE